jgi:hypothetical protein
LFSRTKSAKARKRGCASALLCLWNHAEKENSIIDYR